MPHSPYEGLPPERFWKTGVAAGRPQDRDGFWTPRFALDRTTRIATAGSCFAQHIARNLREQGFSVADREPPPPGLDVDTARRFGFLLYSARYGNIYVVRQLLQLAQEAFGLRTPGDVAWPGEGRWFDALRPGVEPQGLASPALVAQHRAEHLRAVRQVFTQTDLFVFTLGLTEAWVDRADGTVYPTAPGTIAGSFDPARHAFHNFTCQEIVADFLAFRELVRTHNPGLRCLLTVSPVPLTATATAGHVLAATIHSKSVLRAAAGELCARCEDVDYFPSYELIATPFTGGPWFEPNLRSVSAEGVAMVMRTFFRAQGVEMRAATEQATAAAEAPGASAATAGAAERRAGRAARAPAQVAPPQAAQPPQSTDRDARRERRERRERRRARRDGTATAGQAGQPGPPGQPEQPADVCEEALLDAFAR